MSADETPPTGRPMRRRTFLRVSGVVGGGLLLAVAVPAARGFAHRRDQEDDGVFDTWVRIDPDDTVTIQVHHAEMGQGISTALPMILADELDADWSRVRTEFARPGHRAHAHPYFGMIGTGGSSSVNTSFDLLRRAGATGRALLVAAAAARWGVPASELTTERSVVRHGASGRTLRYGELAADAARMPVPAEPVLKRPEQWTLIGTPVKRLDTADKITGRAQFGADVRLPGMLYAAVLMSPVFGGRVKRLDEAAAARMPGVHSVQVIDYQAPVISANPKSLRNAWRYLSSLDQTAFADPDLWERNAVAVVADSWWRAKRALAAVEVEWEGGDATVDDASIERTLRDALDDDAGAGVAMQRGDVAAALRGATRTIEAAYQVPFLAHACMEPMTATADVRADGVDLYGPFQFQGLLPSLVSKMCGVSPAAVQVHSTYLGGGFGRKAFVDYPLQAVQLSQRVGRPVQLIWSREEDIRHDFYRPAGMARLSAGLDANGTVVAWRQRIASPSITQFAMRNVPGTMPESGVDPSSVEGSSDKPYGIPNVLVDCVTRQTAVPVGWWRSVGHTQNAFWYESFLDEVAHAAGADPYEFRRALLAGAARQRTVLDTAATAAGWGTPLPAGRARGIALHESFGSICAQVAEVSVENGRPRVHRVVCAIDCGQVVNPDTVDAQMQSAIAYGLSAALHNEIGIQGGAVRQSNFPDYPVLGMREMPRVDVHIVRSGGPMGGVGEPATPPIAPAVGNALFALTGQRLRRLPFRLGG